MQTTTTRDARVLRSVQRFLSATLLVGSLGTLGELLLLGHTGEATQWIPVVALVCAVLVIAWQAAAPGRTSTSAMAVLMGAFLLIGALGVVLHYRSNTMEPGASSGVAPVAVLRRNRRPCSVGWSSRSNSALLR